jgi:hypothetical protein
MRHRLTEIRYISCLSVRPTASTIRLAGCSGASPPVTMVTEAGFPNDYISIGSNLLMEVELSRSSRSEEGGSHPPTSTEKEEEQWFEYAEKTTVKY